MIPEMDSYIVIKENSLRNVSSIDLLVEVFKICEQISEKISVH